MSWLYLALLAPLLYAIVNLFDDNLLEKVYKSPYLSTVFAGFFGSLPIFTLLFKEADTITLHAAMAASIGGLFTVLYYFFYFRSLRVETPSVVIALFSLAPALLPVFAHIFLRENLPVLAIVGFVIVVVASLSMAIVDLRKFKFSLALIPVVIAVILMDMGALSAKYAYDNSSFYPAYMFFCLGMGTGGLLFLVAKFRDNTAGLREIRGFFWKVLPVFVVAETVNLVAEFTLNLAISRGPVSLVKVIEASQPVYVLLIALVLYPIAPRFFREAEQGRVFRKFMLMFVVIIGLALISYAVS